MSKKYIAQNNVSNFVYPNNTLTQYDVEIIHDLKEDTVTGTVSNFTMSNSGSNVIVSFDYTWNLNTAEPFINNTGQLNVLSLHMMTPDKLYFKPWINVGYISDANTSLTTKSGTASFTVTPAMASTTSFVSGDYFYEVRFIGHRSIYAVPMQAADILPTPTPTPTATPTPTPGLSPTSTPTPTPTPSSTPSGGGGSYNYYSITKYQCHQPSPCTLYEADLFGRTTNPFTLTNGYYYNNGDGFVYLVNFSTAGPTYDVDLDGSASRGTNCILTCQI